MTGVTHAPGIIMMLLCKANSSKWPQIPIQDIKSQVVCLKSFCMFRYICLEFTLILKSRVFAHCRISTTEFFSDEELAFAGLMRDPVVLVRKVRCNNYSSKCANDDCSDFSACESVRMGRGRTINVGRKLRQMAQVHGQDSCG